MYYGLSLSAWIVVIAYLVIVTGIGFVAGFMKPMKRFIHYVVADREIGGVVSGVSATASTASAWAWFGLAGWGFVAGFPALFYPMFFILANFLLWGWIAEPLREQSEKIGSFTLIDHFKKLVNDDKGILALIGGIVVLVFATGYIGSQLLAFGRMGEYIGWGETPPLLAMGAFVVAYTCVGGFRGIAWNDMFEGMVMMVTMVGLTVFAIYQVGGIGAFVSGVVDVGPLYSSWVTVAVGTTAIGLGFTMLGQPHTIQRLIAIRDKKSIGYALPSAIGFSWLRNTFPIIAGISARLVFGFEGLPLEDPELSFLAFAELLHPIVLGFLIISVMAAIMSTADSFLLQGAATFNRNILENFFKVDLKQKNWVILNRLTVVVMGLIGVIIAYLWPGTIFDIVLYAFGGLGSAFGPPLLAMTLKWKKLNVYSIATSYIVGLLATMYFTHFPVGDLHPTLLAFLSAAILMIIVGFATGERKE